MLITEVDSMTIIQARHAGKRRGRWSVDVN